MSAFKYKDLFGVLMGGFVVVLFVLGFNLVSLYCYFIALVGLLFLNARYSILRYIIFFAISLIVNISMPQIAMGFLFDCVDVRYVGMLVKLFLVILVSFFCGRLLFVGEVFFLRGAALFLFGLMLIGGYLYKDILAVDEAVLCLYLFLVSVVTIALSYSDQPVFIGRGRLQYYATLFIAVTLLCVSYVVNNYKGNRKIKLGIITTHSDWARVDIPYSSLNITMNGGYSYSLMKEMLGGDFFLYELNNQSKLIDDLHGLDVAIVITPTRSFNSYEIDALLGFVRKGGRLVFIADHTNLYGHASVINEVLASTGVRIEDNALYHNNSYYQKINLVGTGLSAIRPMTPCSITTKRPVFSYAWSGDWVNEKAVYTRDNFFGDFNWTSDDGYGRWNTGALFRVGHGEVVVWCDSTIFSNFALFLPDNIRFLGMLVEGGGLHGYVALYQPIMIIASLLVLLLFTGIPEVFALCFCALLILMSSSYYIWDFDPGRMYKDNVVYFYGNQKYFLESPPKKMLSNNSISSLYSHIARYGIRPFYGGSVPPQKKIGKTVFVCSADDYCKMRPNDRQNIDRVIIFADNRMLGLLGFKKVYDLSDGTLLSDKLFGPDIYLRVPKFTRNGMHSWGDNRFSILLANGTYSNNEMGDWWITHDISPYRKNMLAQFVSWLEIGSDIMPYEYPLPNVCYDKRGRIFIKTDNGIQDSASVAVTGSVSRDSMIYVGHGVWAEMSRDSDNVFLLGGPEMSDNFALSRYVRWAGVIR